MCIFIFSRNELFDKNQQLYSKFLKELLIEKKKILKFFEKFEKSFAKKFENCDKLTFELFVCTKITNFVRVLIVVLMSLWYFITFSQKRLIHSKYSIMFKF